MKVVYLGIILTFLLITISYAKPIHAESSDPVQILNVQVQPNIIRVNDTFLLDMTILNNSTFPIYLTSGSCTPAFYVVFDNHAKLVSPNIACTTEAILQEVGPQSQVTISNANKPGTIYQAVQSGTGTVNITLPYFAKNRTATDFSNVYYNTSKSFSFTVSNQSGTLQRTYGGGGPAVTITLDPLEQFKSGIAAKDVACKKGLQLVIKAEDGSPACVTSDTIQKLMERGWTKNTTGVSALVMPPVGIYNLTLSTNPIILGIPFYINAVVVNHQTGPITYYNGCVSPLSVSIGNIKTSADSVHCLAISKYTLEPNQSVPVQSDKIETLYNATGPNATTVAEIKFSYESDGQQASMFTSMKIPIQNAIMIDCSGERVILHIAQIDKTVNVTKAIALAYTSPEFIAKVKQYGNVSYNYFSNDWFSSASCHTYWNGTEVMFTANDKNGSRNIQVSEDINLTKVLKVKDFQVGFSK